MNCIWNTNNIGGFKRKKRAQRWGIVVAGGIVFCTVEKFYHFIQHKLHLHSLSIWNEWYCILGKGNKRSVVPTWLGEGMEVTVQHSSPLSVNWRDPCLSGKPTQDGCDHKRALSSSPFCSSPFHAGLREAGVMGRGVVQTLPQFRFNAVDTHPCPCGAYPELLTGRC